MGHAVSAECKCGYSVRELLIGGGMIDHHINCAHPALCSAGEHIVTVNLLEKPITCPDGHRGFPSPYCNSPDLQLEPGSQSISQWGEHELNSGKYLCPKCGKYELEFSDTGFLFD